MYEKWKDIVEHTSKNKYPNQRMFMIELDSQTYLIPNVEPVDEIFLRQLYLAVKL